MPVETVLEVAVKAVAEAAIEVGGEALGQSLSGRRRRQPRRSWFLVGGYLVMFFAATAVIAWWIIRG